jgi:hypothetical protein
MTMHYSEKELRILEAQRGLNKVVEGEAHLQEDDKGELKAVEPKPFDPKEYYETR